MKQLEMIKTIPNILGGKKIKKVLLNVDGRIESIIGVISNSTTEIEFSQKFIYNKHNEKELYSILEKYIDYNGTKVTQSYTKEGVKTYEKLIYANSINEKLFDGAGRVISNSNYFTNGEMREQTIYQYLPDDTIKTIHKNYKQKLITESIIDNKELTTEYTPIVYRDKIYDLDTERLLYEKQYNHENGLKYTIHYYDGRKVETYGDGCRMLYNKYGEFETKIITSNVEDEGAYRRIFTVTVLDANDSFRSITLNDLDIGSKIIKIYKDTSYIEERIMEPLVKQKGAILTKTRSVFTNNTNNRELIASYTNRYIFNGHKYRLLDKKIFNDNKSSIEEYKYEKGNIIITRTEILNGEYKTTRTTYNSRKEIIEQFVTNDNNIIVIEDRKYKQDSAIVDGNRIMVLVESEV